MCPYVISCLCRPHSYCFHGSVSSPPPLFSILLCKKFHRVASNFLTLNHFLFVTLSPPVSGNSVTDVDSRLPQFFFVRSRQFLVPFSGTTFRTNQYLVYTKVIQNVLSVFVSGIFFNQSFIHFSNIFLSSQIFFF